MYCTFYVYFFNSMDEGKQQKFERCVHYTIPGSVWTGTNFHKL